MMALMTYVVADMQLPCRPAFHPEAMDARLSTAHCAMPIMMHAAMWHTACTPNTQSQNTLFGKNHNSTRCSTPVQHAI